MSSDSLYGTCNNEANARLVVISLTIFGTWLLQSVTHCSFSCSGNIKFTAGIMRLRIFVIFSGVTTMRFVGSDRFLLVVVIIGRIRRMDGTQKKLLENLYNGTKSNRWNDYDYCEIDVLLFARCAIKRGSLTCDIQLIGVYNLMIRISKGYLLIPLLLPHNPTTTRYNI